MMRRREFITLLGGAAAAWPLAARAQRPDSTRRIGVLTGAAENDPEGQLNVAAFRQGLQELGWTEGRNVRIEYRWTAADPERIRTYVAELVALRPDVIFANSSLVVAPLQKETRTIPIVFTQINDPVGSGFVASLARPGGNITGFTPGEFSMYGKFPAMLKEIAPSVTQMAVLLNPDQTPQLGMLHAIEAVASSLGVRLNAAGVRDAAEIDRAVGAFERESNAGLIVLASPITNLHRDLIIALAAKYRLPAVYAYRYFVVEGGLISYGVNVAELYRRAAAYVDRILKGTNPADLPVQQPTKFELAINLKTAKALGITVPLTLLVAATDVIE
jgi:putative ABC transport system substrate-binding protein